MRTRRTAAMAAALMALAGLLASHLPAGAEPVKCQRDIAKAAAKYAQDRSKILAKCEQAKIGGKIAVATNCLADPDTLAALAGAESKLESAIAKSCGGADQTCGAGGDDDSPASIGWPNTCPNFESGSCSMALLNCGDVASCLACIHGAAMDQENSVVHGALALPSTASKTVNKCQATISKETQKFLAAKSKILQKCWDSRLQAKHVAACPDASISDTKHPARKAADAIAKAEAKMTASICKACGGDDKACGGGDDLTTAQIGFAANCPNVDVPGGATCKITGVDSLSEIEQCLSCVTEFKVDCVDRAAVPGLTSYPGECNPTFGPTCSKLDVTVSTAFAPPGGGDFVSGVTIALDYNQNRLELPGFGVNDPPTVARVMDLTGIVGNLLTVSDNDSVAGVGILNLSTPVPSGNFAKMQFDCRAGLESPVASGFTCSAESGTFFGDDHPATCSVVSVNPIP